MDTLTASSTINLNSIVTTPKEWNSADPAKYLRLSRIDRDHATTLAQSCCMSAPAEAASRILAHRSLQQCILTSIPLIVADFVTMWSILFLTTAVVERLFGIPTTLVTRHTALVASLLLAPIARLKGMYPAVGTSPAVEFREIVQSAATALCIFAGIGIVAKPGNWGFLIFSSLLSLTIAVPLFPAVRYAVRGLLGKCSWWGSPVLIYANASVAAELFHRIHHTRQRGLRPAAVLLPREEYWKAAETLTGQGIPVYGLEQALECALKYNATWLIVGAVGRVADDCPAAESEAQVDLNAIPNRLLLTTAGFDCGMWDRTHTVGTVSGLWLSNSRHSYSQQSLKRFMDILLTTLASMIFAPLLLAIALAIRIGSPGPIFYSQKRLGRGGRIFKAWKFRSMVPNADHRLKQVLENDSELRREWETTHKLKYDPRVTWIGRLIRATSLDELPQLWNIFCGDMSVVGPRPIIDSPTYDAAYVNEYPNEYAAYCSVRPGLTGLWQVTCRNSGVYEMRIYWDMYYIRNWSLWLDLYIILRTIRTVLLREGAY